MQPTDTQDVDLFIGKIQGEECLVQETGEG